MKKITPLFLLVLLFLFPLQTLAAERVYLDISSSKTRMINIAVPWFTNQDLPDTPQNFGSEVADTLAKALKFHGIISIYPTSEYGGKQNANLKNRGVDYSVIGSYKISSGDIRFEMRLIDVASGAMITGKSYQGERSLKDQMLFKFCDDVIYELTGSKGIASTQIAFVSNSLKAKELFITDILGRKLRQVTRHKNLVVSPRFTPDNTHISYTSYHKGNQSLYITDLRQSKTTRALSRRKGMNLAPAWSPDGKNCILTLSNKGNPDLFMLDRTGNIIKQITRNTGISVSPSYSPDGRQIVFASDRSGKPQIYLYDLPTGRTQRLTFDQYENTEPSWSPTENLIVYTSLRDGVYQLCMVKPESDATPVQITQDLSHHESPSWSPDGRQIIFSKKDGKENKIYGIMKNGSYQRRLFNFPGNQTYPRWAYNY